MNDLETSWIRRSVARMAYLLLWLPLTVGCGPAVDDEDLGTILRTAPAVSGTEEPYQIPGPATPEQAEEDSRPEQAPKAEAQSPPQSEGDLEAEDSGNSEIGKDA